MFMRDPYATALLFAATAGIASGLAPVVYGIATLQAATIAVRGPNEAGCALSSWGATLLIAFGAPLGAMVGASLGYVVGGSLAFLRVRFNSDDQDLD